MAGPDRPKKTKQAQTELSEKEESNLLDQNVGPSGAVDLDNLTPGEKLPVQAPAADSENAKPPDPTVEQLPEPIVQKPENPTDKARKNIAYWLLGILTGIVIASFLLLLWALRSGQGSIDDNFKNISGLLNIIYGPVVTLVGSAVGFYFGAKSNQPEENDPT
jgi:hypothetical protein